MIFDIETKLQKDNKIIDTLLNNVSAKKNLTDPDKIEKDITAKRENIMNKAQLNPLLSEIAVVSVFSNDKIHSYSSNSLTEKQMLTGLMRDIENDYYTDIYTYNGKRFDIPYIIVRALHNDMSNNISYLKELKYKHIDLYDLISSFDNMSQDMLCESIYGLKPETPLILQNDFEGNEEDYVEYLKNHCEEDVKMLAMILGEI